MTEIFADRDALPELPYAGTSGWSGSETSRERAERDDTSGTTSKRQGLVLGHLAALTSYGMTWKELSEDFNLHHGQASGTLSVLHKTGRVARLTEKRDRCAVYVLPQWVGDRETAPHGNVTDWKQRALDAEARYAEHMATHTPRQYVL